MADVETILKAAPIGLILFIGSYLGMRKRRAGWDRARDEFPVLAGKLGLTHAPGEGRSIGRLRGSLGGFDVFVDPDDQPRIILRFVASVPVELRTYERRRMASGNMERFDPAMPAIDELFKERYAAPGMADVLYERAEALDRALEPFRGRFGGHLKDMTVTEEGITCHFDYGKPLYIPADVVDEVLASMVVLARLLAEAAGQAGGDEPPAPPASDPWHGPPGP